MAERAERSRCGECGGTIDADSRCEDCGTQHGPAPDRAEMIDENSDEGMLREAADLLRFGVARWNNSNFAWVADDLVERIDARYPGSKDVVPRG